MSKAESEIARIVWELGSATVRQVVETIGRQRHVEFKTVQTYLRRLESKGYLRSRMDKGSKVYRPRVRSRQVIGEVVDDLMDRLFGGEAMPLLQYLIEERGISRDDVVRLRELLTQLEAEHNGP
jgi:predicted transcriptional regulator